MYRNVASQVIGVQMVTAADGTAFTGTVSAFVTKDGGTQAAGGGTVTHEGNGYHGYVPTQAETDAAHVAFTFTGTGAIPATVQVEPIDKLAADALNASAKTIGFGTVGTGSTTTSVVVSAVNVAGATSVGANSLAGRRVYFRGDTASASLQGEGARITANTAGTAPTLTLDAADVLTASPASGDIFAIL
jgi:hypothetical protein